MAYVSLTYFQIMADVFKWTDDPSEEFQDQLDGIIQLAETDVLRDLDLAGFRNTVSAGTCSIGNAVLAYPQIIKTDALWLTISGVQTPIYYRKYDWCVAYASGVGGNGPPKYYAEINNAYYLSPSPDQTYAAQVKGIVRPTGLSDANPTTWLSTNVGDLVLLRTLLRSEEFLVAAAPVTRWKTDYAENLTSARREFANLTYQDFMGTAAGPTIPVAAPAPMAVPGGGVNIGPQLR